MADATRPPATADLQFSFTVQRDGDVARLVFAGEIDLNVATAAQQAIVDALTVDPPDRLDVDLGQLTFLDSRGLSALITGRRLADANGRGYRVLNARGAVLRTLQITALLPFLNGTPDGAADGPSAAAGPSADQDGTEPLDGTGR